MDGNVSISNTLNFCGDAGRSAFGAVILAGGKSRRMGTDKAGLRINGVRFLDKLVFELSGFAELLVSVDDARRHPEISLPMVSDRIFGCGPMGGVAAALEECVSDALVVISCDVPLFSKSLADAMCASLCEDVDAVIAVTKDGRKHPLCGVYKKSCLPVFLQCLEAHDYRMKDALDKLKVVWYPVKDQSWRLENVNTPADYAQLQKKSCLAVCGWKNSGKTTLMERLIARLSQKGLKVSAIKHDGHSFVPDVPGTDSCRFLEAGAYASAVYDKEKFTVTKQSALTEEAISVLFEDSDLILLEGFKWSSYPKLEVFRPSDRTPGISGICGRLAFVRNCAGCGEQFQAELQENVPVFDMENIQGIAAFVMEAFSAGTLKERWNNEKDIHL